VHWVYLEVVLVGLAAMLSPTTLTFSTLAVVLSKRPLFTAIWFYLGAFGATLAVGVIGALVIGDAAATHHPSTPKTWVAVLDVVLGAALIILVILALRRPANPQKEANAIEKMRGVASSPWIAVLAAGAMLANAGIFMPIELKSISETDPTVAGYLALWVCFTVVALLPLGVAVVMLLVAPDWTKRVLDRVRVWLQLHARAIAAVIVILLAASLLRGGIAGLTS
jgi:hypothetical protein